MAQTAPQQTRVMRTTLEAIDHVFRPLAPHDPAHRKEPASVKKMLKGEACWATTKRILGWDLDTVAETIHLPPHRLERLYELLESISPPHKRVSVKRWHQLLGELRSMSPALPGARGLFSILQESLKRADRSRVHVTRYVWDMASDFRGIADSLQSRPTRLRELVPGDPEYIGASDECISGMGEVWFARHHLSPMMAPPILVWHRRYPPAVQAALITSALPHGSISISDLELAAMIAHKDVLAQHQQVAERTIWMATDNATSLAWSNKGSATSSATRAYLLRLNSFHKRRHCYVAVHNHIVGAANVMADDASRRWDLSDADLLTYFNSHYPQASPWRLCALQHDTDLALLGALFRQQPTHGSHDSASPLPAPPHGACGALSATTS
ncbi:hypothetical protein MHU86_22589 [Fragilaria crotonensis]|nr:hypothetical protein MHU86_22589 [Fragilaria crotonensis]